MQQFFKDFQILQNGARLVRILYWAKIAVSVALIVFAAAEATAAVRGKQGYTAKLLPHS